MRVVLDTSVAIAWYLDEAGCEPARAWQAECMSGRLDVLVPTLHYLEVANVLRTYVRRQEITVAQACAIYSLHLDAPLQAVEPEAESVLRIAMEYDATAYDAAFIQVALSHDAPLVTAESASRPWVRKLGRLAIAAGACGNTGA